MVIHWYGEGCFKITEGKLTMMVDPFEKETGLTPPRFKADIVLHTKLPIPSPKDEKPLAKDSDDDTHLIVGPGEYEVQGVRISGWPRLKGSDESGLKSVFRVRLGDFRLGFLGELSTVHEPELIEALGDIDILFIPGGGAPFIPQGEAAKLIRQISPRAVIPTHVKTKGLKRKADPATDFLKELDQDVKPQERFTIKQKDLSEKTQVVVLENKTA